MDKRKWTKLSLKIVNEFAVKKGGKCLSTEYINAKTKLHWVCKQGHEWNAVFHSIKKGSWCPECVGRRRLTLADAHLEAKKRNGKCLSKELVNSRTYLNWECSNSHIFPSTLDNVRAGNWCNKCTHPIRALALRDIQNIAIERGGKCLSKIYIDPYTKLEWQCKYGHNWSARATDIIKRGSWCKDCSVGLMERVCRQYFEQIFNKPFPNIRPDWLINLKTSQRLELDGYSEELKIAFEYHGQHHYKLNSLFHKKKEDLALRKDLDKLKEKLVKEQGIKLIEIPQIPNYLKLENLMSYLLKKFEENSIVVPENMLNMKIDLFKAYAPDESKYIEIINKLVESKNGKFLSGYYLGLHTKLEFECEYGHQWPASPAKVVLQNRWCPYCAKAKRANSSSKVHEEISKLGLTFPGEYKTLHSRFQVKCKKCELSWETSLALIRERKVKRGFVCLRCSGNRVQNEPDLLMPFEQAREFVRGLKLKNIKEWNEYVKGKRPDLPVLPFNIPTSFYGPYKNKGFTNMGDLLGTNYIATHERVYRPFDVAREFARGLGLKNSSEWLKYVNGKFPQLPKFPDDIPKYPNDCKYTDNGWKSWADWLDTKNVKGEFLSFEGAREYARSLKLKNRKQWLQYAKGELKDKKPINIPNNPSQVYSHKWSGWDDWLGESYAGIGNYFDFGVARGIVRELKLKNRNDWLKYTKSDKKHPLVPATPNTVYKNKGWIGYNDWLGNDIKKSK